jgi:hypothetical protein
MNATPARVSLYRKALTTSRVSWFDLIAFMTLSQKPSERQS